MSTPRLISLIIRQIAVWLNVHELSRPPDRTLIGDNNRQLSVIARDIIDGHSRRQFTRLQLRRPLPSMGRVEFHFRHPRRRTCVCFVSLVTLLTFLTCRSLGSSLLSSLFWHHTSWWWSPVASPSTTCKVCNLLIIIAVRPVSMQ